MLQLFNSLITLSGFERGQSDSPLSEQRRVDRGEWREERGEYSLTVDSGDSPVSPESGDAPLGGSGPRGVDR